jgi:hypothetical protein
MKRNAPVLLLLVAIVVLSGCGVVAQSGTPIMVTITMPPPSSLPAVGTASVAATVSNDTAGAGVNWSCTPSSACGSFNPVATASGASTTYTAPSAVPAGGQVVIMATSMTDSGKKANASVTITGSSSNASLNGRYALLLTAATGNQQGPSVCAASVIADGNGNITGGVEELTAPGFYDLVDLVSNGTYSIDASGHGTMTIHTANLETLKFSFVLTSASHALIVEADGDPASGTMDLQQPAGASFTAAQISGNYSFMMDGVDNSGALKDMSLAGSFAADGIGSLTAGTLDINNGGTFSTTSFTGSFTAPDSNGRGTMTVNAGRSFVYYIISPKVLRVLEGDNISFVGGSAYARGSAGSTIAALSGKFVYQHHGWSSAGRTVAAGQFSADGAGRVTAGMSDSNLGGSPTIVNTGKSVTGTYMISGSPSGTLTLSDAAGTSTFNLYLVDPALNILDPGNSTGGGGALLLHTDASIIGTGILIPQVVSGSPSFSQNQGLNLANSVDPPNMVNVNEVHLVGRLASDGAANFTGTADYAQNGAYFPNVVKGNTLSGTFAADSVNPGHFTGSFTLGTDPTIALFPFIAPAVSMFQVSYYQASASQALVIQTDTSADAWGYLLKQQLP